jgi:hypothetical protein
MRSWREWPVEEACAKAHITSTINQQRIGAVATKAALLNVEDLIVDQWI